MGELGADIQALATADDPAHAAHRKLLVPQLTAKRINELELFARETADRLWNEGVHDGSIEWMSAMANRLPMMIVTRLIGVPDVDIEQLERWGYSSTKLVEGLVDQDRTDCCRRRNYGARQLHHRPFSSGCRGSDETI